MGFKDKIMLKAIEKAMKSGKLKERIEKAQRDMVTWEKDIRKKEQDRILETLENMALNGDILFDFKDRQKFIKKIKEAE